MMMGSLFRRGFVVVALLLAVSSCGSSFAPQPKRSAFDTTAFLAYPGATYTDEYHLGKPPGRDLENRPTRDGGTYYYRLYTLAHPVSRQEFWDWVYTTRLPPGWRVIKRHDGRIPDGTTKGIEVTDGTGMDGGDMVYEAKDHFGYAVNRIRVGDGQTRDEKELDLVSSYGAEFQVWGDCPKGHNCGTIPR
jgi:hypothetical protein